MRLPSGMPRTPMDRTKEELVNPWSIPSSRHRQRTKRLVDEPHRPLTSNQPPIRLNLDPATAVLVLRIKPASGGAKTRRRDADKKLCGFAVCIYAQTRFGGDGIARRSDRLRPLAVTVFGSGTLL